MMEDALSESALQDLVQPITAAAADLVWLSETDAGFDLSVWADSPDDSMTPVQVLSQAKLPPDTPIETLELQAFLAPVLDAQPWHTPAETAMAEGFRDLQTLLEQTLTDLQVYRCGTVEVEIYIVGYAAGLGWVALHTSAVET